MRTTLKASLTAIMLTSVAAVPLATATTFLTADAAYAKSDKAKGGSKGKGGEMALLKGKGKSGDKSASRGGSGHGGLDKFLGKLTGKDKKTTRTASVRSNGKVKVGKDDPMHPSNLGNMNGALNSSPNAMLAHIRNGNTNGPVGELAALAVARTDAYGAQDIVELEAAYANLETQIELAGYESLEDYLQKKEGVEPITPLDDAIAAAEAGRLNPDTTEEEQAILDKAVSDELEKASYETVEDYEMDVTPDEAVQKIEDELINLGYDEEDGSFAEDRPSEEDVAKAEEAIMAEDDATASILDYWNKGDATTEGSQELLEALQAKIDANADAIEAAKPVEDGMTGDGDVATCEEGAESCEPAEEDLAAAE